MNYYIYGIEAGESAIKIGISANPEKRIKELQTANHEELNLAFVIMVAKTLKRAGEIEFAIHKRLDPYRLNGEWFKFGITKSIVGQIIREIDSSPKKKRPSTAPMAYSTIPARY
jgi:hypothetical protein